MPRLGWRRPERRNRPHDAHPHELVVAVAAIEHQIGPPGGFTFGIGAMQMDQLPIIHRSGTAREQLLHVLWQ
jgi:hypothetical protein